MTKLLPSLSVVLFALPLVACDFGSSTDPAPGTPPQTGGATSSSGGSPSSSGGTSVSSGGSGAGSSSTATPSPGFGTPRQVGIGASGGRYEKAEVSRNDVNYKFMANGWGPGFVSQQVSWNGTSFTVASMEGKQGSNYEPASYPTTFCGEYSDDRSGACGLPKAIADIKSLRTGWRWKANGNAGQYNAAYDIWLGTGTSISTHSSFLMVWLRDPPGQQPAGGRRVLGVQVANVPGTWDIWAGTILGKPCISYSRAEGQDSAELEFDVMDFVRDLPGRSISAPGSHILSVAVGFEIWNGPITNLVSEDFYVEVK